MQTNPHQLFRRDASRNEGARKNLLVSLHLGSPPATKAKVYRKVRSQKDRETLLTR